MDAPYTRSAAVYDVVYADPRFDYPGHAADVVRLIRDRNPDAATLLEVGCGTGRFFPALCAEFAVTGLDVSPEMLAEARRRFPDVEVVEADMRDFDLGREFDAVACLFSSIGYVTSTEELYSAVAAMARHLAPGGVLVVDGWIRPAEFRDGRVSVDTFVVEGTTVVRVSYGTSRGDLSHLDMHHLVGTEGEGVTYFAEGHDMLLVPDEGYVAALTAAGLTDVVVTDGYPRRARLAATRR